jgi:hypothetical protein
MPQGEAYQAPERGTERWKSALAKRATRLEEEYNEEGDDFEFLCPGDVIQYHLHPNPMWFTDTIVSTDPNRAPFMIHCLKEHVHDYTKVGIVATRDKLGVLQPVAKNE